MIRSRIGVLFIYLLLAYLVLIGRLVYLQVIRAPFYKEKAHALTARTVALPARRGTIFDREMNKLAVSVDAYDISADPRLIKDKAGVSKILSGLLGIPEQVVTEKLTSRKKGFVYLLRRADVEIGDKVKEAKIDGIDVSTTTKRVYPGGELASHIIGFTNVDGKGMEGLERRFDKQLKGRDGYIIGEFDAKNHLIPGSIRARLEPENGKDLVLTIDTNLQHGLESDLRKSYQDHQAAGASAIIMDPRTGEILALANMPDFNPNHPGDSESESRRNRALADLYEPGSTLKTITACAAMETKAVGLNETFYCHGSTKIGNSTVRCSLHGHEFAHGHGVCNTGKMLKYSCNIAAAAIGARVGKQRLYNFEQKFGMYERPGSEMPGEVRGWHDNWEDWADIRLANISFGQGIAVTPLQMARAYCAVSNGGLLMRPYVVKSIMKDGKVEKEFVPQVSRRVISRGTSETVSDMLTGVVSDGTGQTAQLDGYLVAGKTGSAQKAVGGRYVAGKVVASFAGFLPVSRPRAVILVAVDEPKGSHFGAVVAAPVFQAVAKRTMWRLKVPPDAPQEAGTKAAPAIPAKRPSQGNHVDTGNKERPRMGG